MKNNKKLIEYIFLGFLVFWILAIETLTVLIVEPSYLKFITNQGVFFLPLLATLGLLFITLYIFVFKYPVIKDVKNKLADVYKKGNIDKADFDKIADGIDTAIKNQSKIEFENKVEELKEINEIKQIKVEQKLKEAEIKKEIVENTAKTFDVIYKNSKLDTEFDKKMESY